jgi:glucose/arabinose dehydrogenase
MKFFQGRWDQPGLGGDATSLGKGAGVSVARWTTIGGTVLWGSQGLGFSTDHTTFARLREPLLIPSHGSWNRHSVHPDPSELTAYGPMRQRKSALALCF